MPIIPVGTHPYFKELPQDTDRQGEFPTTWEKPAQNSIKDEVADSPTVNPSGIAAFNEFVV
jgi:hypothetical protein